MSCAETEDQRFRRRFRPRASIATSERASSPPASDQTAHRERALEACGDLVKRFLA
jgi:hypothetical protein